MALDRMIEKLETSNTGIGIMLESLDEQLAGMRAELKTKDLVDDLENLFNAYLKTWMRSNNEILDLLRKEKSKAN